MTEKEKTVTEELSEVLEEIVETPAEEKKKGEPVTMVDAENLLVGERQYRLVANYREGFDADKLGERYSDVLSRYDYIVGDWGYDQLRLKGFFKEDDRKAHPDQRIDTLEDYLYEFCNFGCAYFVIQRIGGKRDKQQRRKRKRKNPSQSSNQPDKQQAHIAEKKAPVTKKKPVIRKKETKKTETRSEKSSDKGFVIRQREE